MRTKRPVLILIDGFRLGPSNLVLVSRYYESLGFIVERIPFDRTDILDLSEYGMSVAAFIVGAHRRYPDCDLYSLAYSMGGLAMLDAIKSGGIGPLIRGAVSYGTPYRGLPIASIATPLGAVWRTISHLRLLSPYLRRLHALPMPDGLPIVSIAGAGDLICPAPLCHLKGGENVIVAGGHMTFMYRTSLHDRIAKRLLKR